MKRFAFILLAACSTYGYSQNTATTEDIVRKVADNIIASTSFKFINNKTKETFSTTEGRDTSINVKAESKFNRWQYVNGVLTVGMIQLADATGENRYSEYSKKNFNFIFDNIGYFKKQFDAGTTSIEYRPVMRMGSLDDVGAMSAGLMDVYAFDKRKDYMDYLQRGADHIINKQSKFPDGTLARNSPRRMTLWADDLYMSVPFIARMGKLTGDNKYFDFAIDQVEKFNRYIYDSTTGLYFHAYYNDENTNGVARWGRCNGWVALAQVELLNHLPANHPKRPELIKLLLRQVIGFSRYQDTSGMWHQLLDKQNSYEESSVTAMYVYTVARAVNQGWISPRYLSIAQLGWNALAKKVTQDGRVPDICIGTSVEEDILYYYNRPKELNDTHGLGAFLLAGTEMIRAKAKLTDLNKRR